MEFLYNGFFQDRVIVGVVERLVFDCICYMYQKGQLLFLMSCNVNK